MWDAAPKPRRSLRVGRIVLLFVFLGLLSPPSLWGQSTQDHSRRLYSHLYAPEAGEIPRRYVGPDVYDASKQNWDATQDTSGTFYVGNTEGILVYDGHTWRTIDSGNESIVRSVGADAHGRVFVGAQREFGVLRRDSTGRRRYISLLDHVPEEHRTFTDVWQTEATAESVYFRTSRRLFRWNSKTKTMQSWAPPEGTEFNRGGVVDGTYYVDVGEQGEWGLMAVQGDSLRRVAGGAIVSNRTVLFVRPHPRYELVVGTYDGLFVRENGSFRRLQTDIPDLLRSAWVQRGRVLPDGTIAIATIDEGLLLVGSDGTLRRRLTPEDAPVPGVYLDDEGGLWALLDGGLMRYDLAALFTEYDDRIGLEGSVRDVVRHQGRLYVATLQDLYRRQSSGDSLRMVSVPDISTQTWTLLSVGKNLLVGTVTGLDWIGPDGAVRDLFEARHVYKLRRSRHDSSLVYAATGRGVRLVRRTDEGWTPGPMVPGLDTEARTFAETDDGTLWVGTSFDGVYRVQWDDAIDSTTVDHFTTEHGLPSDRVDPQRWNGELIFGTSTGLMRYVEAPSPHFEPVTTVEGPSQTLDEGVFRLQKLEKGQAWGFTGWGPSRWIRRDTTWQWAPGPLHRLRGRSVNMLQGENDGHRLWMGTQEGLLRYTTAAPEPGPPPAVRIQSVRALQTDSLLSTGYIDDQTLALPHAQNGVHVSYGTPSLVEPSAIEYQYRVTNRQEEWSDWTPRTERELQNLASGTVTFSVRARTAYGDTTAATRYSFTVLPPWYRTWWAYGLYGLLAFGLVAGAVRWRTHQLRRRQEHLETAVAERTAEIERQKDQLAEQAERLQELDDAKSRFFANITHEFRTPLTLIRGPVQQVRRDWERGRLKPVSDDAEANVEHLSIVERNVDRLQRLIDQVLGLARLEAGTYELDPRPTDLEATVERLAQEFEPLAERANLDLTVKIDGSTSESASEKREGEPLYVDREALEHILSNLMSNAIKFTPAGGRVEVAVQGREDPVALVVRDTGTGIPDDEEDAIFERFAQVDDSATREQEGAGIGLAFTKDLVDLHGGTIRLDSTEGEGTTVTVRLPRGTEHLSGDKRRPPHASEQEAPAESTQNEGDSEASSSTVNGRFASPNAVSASDGAPASEATSSPDDPLPDDPESQSKIVLVVDDNADVRRYVRSVLEPTFEVVGATNGEEGLAVARERLPDVILADIMMPEMDGHELTRRLKDEPETEAIPVIMVTARAETQDEVAGLKIGANDYVTKPFDADVLRQRVGGVLTLQERLRRHLEAELRDETDDDATDSPPAAQDRPEVERRARTIIREHLTEPDFEVTDLAEEMAMSRSTLYRKLKGEAETTPSALITLVRIEEAKTLLRDGEPVTQVAYAVGYDRLSTFTSVFTDHVGQPPSALAKDAPK